MESAPHADAPITDSNAHVDTSNENHVAEDHDAKFLHESDAHRSLAQNVAVRSGRRVAKPKCFISSAILGFLSSQSSVNAQCCSPATLPSVFQSQMTCHENLHSLDYGTLSSIHAFSHVVSKESTNVLHYDREMKAEDTDCFREAMGTKISSFKEEIYSNQCIFLGNHLKNI